jgi:hypothetical protein
MVVLREATRAKEAAMFSASAGGGDAARSGVYRHALVRLMIPLLAPLGSGWGWSPVALALGAVLMSWDSSPTLGQRFESMRAVLDDALPRRRRTGRTYQGFVKALARHSATLIDPMTTHLRTLSVAAAGKEYRVGRWVPIGADGSKFDAPRTVANESLGLAGKDKCGPQMVLLLLVHLGAMLPWAWKIGGARDAERTLLRSLLDDLPEGTLLVADAGFTGFDLLSELRRRRLSFLIRVGSGVRLLRRLGYYTREGKHTVYLWPDAQRERPPLVLRLIRVGSVCLITDVTDPRELSSAMASELYRRRWGLEVAFRSLKQTLQRRKVRSGTPANAQVELNWAVLGLWVLTLLGARAIHAARHVPRHLSAALTLATLRHAAHTRLGPRALRRRLRRCVLDRYRRRSSKRAYRWPHKKTPAPPGLPTITSATRSQVSAARALRRQISPA